MSVISEYFTSSSHLKDLLHSELILRDRLRDYIHRNELKLEKLKAFYVKSKDNEKHISEGNVTMYAGNPLFIFRTIRRMTKDWRRIKESANVQDSFLSALYDMKDSFPKEDDMYGAKSAIIRLQDTFAIPSRTILDGLEDNTGIIPKLDIIDAFQFGDHAYREMNPVQSISWMNEVVRLLNLNETTFGFNVTRVRFQAYDVLSWAEYQIGNILTSYNYTLELLKLDPMHARINENFLSLSQIIKEQNITLNKEELDSKDSEKRKEKTKKDFPFHYTPDEDEGYRYNAEKERANELCRGETDPIPERYKKYLICWYRRDHPSLILKPAKLERLYPKPELIMFRDAIREEEMARIKELADPLLQRATVHNPVTGKIEAASYRVSKSAWLSHWDDAVLWKKMNDRIQAYTGLDMKHTEELQIANYGIGGFYEPHFDFARIVPLRPPPWEKRDNYTHLSVTSNHQRNLDAGERIATMLFYMSEVKSGGATVFTNIGQAVQATKGDAVFWYNLMHDGSGDYLTRHAACPVLLGEKWVCNRWIHEFGQEFRRQCGLRHNDDWTLTKDGVFNKM